MDTNSLSETHSILGLDIVRIVIGVAGVVSNVVLFIANNRRKDEISTDRELFTLTILLDLAQAMQIICGTVVRTVSPGTAADGSVWCAFSYILGHTTAVASINLVALLSLMRYLSIVRGCKQRTRFWVAVGFALLTALCALDLARVANSILYVSPSSMYCAPFGMGSALQAVLSYISFIMFVSPLVIIPICYLMVGLFYRRTYINMHGGELPQVVRRRLLGLLLITVGYYIAILPKCISIILRTFNKAASPTFDAWFAILFSLVPIINAMFPLLFHQEVRNAAPTIFRNK
ncbi:hypothetical protein DSO57_1027130 [Entomophthora muscae]|uniref:Uncharacterized protein n=1 Tax=Entomophthora muscae TaxID=34485 RepID=A0ACC2RGM7_9FUNG|nr:hypothetical protein DSO57_1027130 [Entomophthora muscae]